MTTDRDVANILRSWLRDDVASPSVGIVDAALDQVHGTPQRRALEPAERFGQMNRPIRVAVAAAAAVVVVATGLNLLPRQDDGGATLPSASSTPTPAVSREPSSSVPYVITGPVSGPGSTLVVPGRYRLRGPGFDPVGWPSAVTVTIPDQWYAVSALRGAGLKRGEGNAPAALTVSSVGALVSEPCADGSGGTPPDAPLGPSVDDLVAGLMVLPGLELSAPVDVTVDGWRGKQLELDLFEGCGDGATLWLTPAVGGESWSVGTGDGMHSTVRILDVDGLRLVVMSSHAITAPASVKLELQQMVDSIDIEP